MNTWFKRNMFLKDNNSLQRSKSGVSRLIPLRQSKNCDSKGVLIRMINDSLALGGSEIFIGNGARQAFQFFAGGQTHCGTLPLEAIKEIRELTSERSPIILEWPEVNTSELRLSITKGGACPVYCFSWKKRIETPDIDGVAAQSIQAPSTSKPLILIVDDDLRFSQILSRILEEHGFQTLTALNGNEGISVLQDFNPALVITDVHMPYLDGPEFLLESRRRGYQAPYLVLTNDENALTEAELIILGASAFVKKSDDPRVLLAWCRRLTGLKRVA